MYKKIMFILAGLMVVAMSHALPFFEDWSSGNFDENNWTFDPSQGNWDIVNDWVLNTNIATFEWSEDTDYSFALVSPTLDAAGFTEVFLQYDYALSNFELTGDEHLSVEVFDGTDWIEIITYSNDVWDIPWTSESFDISQHVAGEEFQVRFRAHGADAYDINNWDLNDILINDGSAPEPGSISGHVVDADTQNQINSAMTVLHIDDEEWGQLNYQDGGIGGNYGFSYDEIPAGTYQIKASAAGYENHSQVITLSAGEDLELIIELTEQEEMPAPENLNAQIIGTNDVELNWSGVDYSFELGYDDGSAEYMLPYNPDANMLIVANKYSHDETMQITNLDYYIEIHMQMMPLPMDDPEMKLYIVEADENEPNLDAIIAGPIVVDNILTMQSVSAYWLSVPVDVTIDADEEFFVCIEWEQDSQYDNYFSLGLDMNEPIAGNSSFTNDGSTWIPFSGQFDANAMIRVQAKPSSGGIFPAPDVTRNFDGYNVYRNDTLITTDPVSETTYLDEDLDNGIYEYYVTALYDDGESDPTNTEEIEIVEFMPPTITHLGFGQDSDTAEYYLNLRWQTIFSDDIEGYNIFRNDEFLIYIEQPENPYPLTNYYDFDIENLQEYTYYMTAVYTDGESGPSDTYSHLTLYPAYPLYGIPWEDHIDLYWDEPELPDSRDLIGYNLYKNWNLVNDEPLTETEYQDYEVTPGMDYYYSVKAIYNEGEASNSNNLMLTPGENVILPPTDLSGEVEDDDVHLTWERPDDGCLWIGRDNDEIGGDFGMSDNSEFTALTHYDTWDLLEYDSYDLKHIGFIPTEENATYTLKIWEEDPFIPGTFNLQRTKEIEDITPGEWNIVKVHPPVIIIGGTTNMKVGITVSDYDESPIAYDSGPNVNDKSDLIMLDDDETENLSDHGIDANWKIRLFLEYDEPIIPVRNDRFTNKITLNHYNLYRNDEIIAELDHIYELYTDEALEAGEYTYHITAVYDVMGCMDYESEYGEQISIIIEEEPAEPLPPANVTMDEATATLSWDEPGYTEFRYDDGTATAQLGFNEASTNSVLGTVWRKNAIIEDVAWYLTDEAGPHPYVIVRFFGLDASGQPDPNNLIAEYDDVPNEHMVWNTYQLPEPLELEDGFMIGLSVQEINYPGEGFLALGCDDGLNEPWEFNPETMYASYDYNSENFTAIEDWEFTNNFMLRAYGTDLGDVSFDNLRIAHSQNTYSHPLVSLPLQRPIDTGMPVYPIGDNTWQHRLELEGYKVYLDGVLQGETEELSWTFEDLEYGQEYIAGVSALYDEDESEIVEVEFTYTITGADDMEVPLVTKLETNYPNPFNPETTIRFSLAQAGNVTLEIFNIRGQKITTLIDEEMEASHHSIVWNGRNDSGSQMPSGMYLYRLSTPDYTKTKKMMLIK
jgi:hypothetical protein